MPKRPTTDTLLTRLRTLRQNPAGPALPQALHEILSAPLTHGIVLKLIAAHARHRRPRPHHPPHILDALAIHKTSPHLRAQLTTLANEHPDLTSPIHEIFAL